MAKVRVNWGRLDADCLVKLYEVYNTSLNRLLVLARDTDTALSIAQAANHVYGLYFSRKDRSYPHAAEVREPLNGRFSDHSALIHRAITQRIQGTVHLEDDGIAIGHEVIGS